MAVEWIPPRRPEGLRALLSPAPAPAHDVGKFLFTPPSCRPRGLPQVRETLRTQGPAGFPPRGNPRLTCKDFGDPRVNSSQVRQAGRQAGRHQDLSSCSPLRLYRRAAEATNKGVLVARQSAQLGARHHTWSLPVQTRHSFDRRRRDDRPHDRPTSGSSDYSNRRRGDRRRTCRPCRRRPIGPFTLAAPRKMRTNG